jgi:S1-C subfamily serine protease
MPLPASRLAAPIRAAVLAGLLCAAVPARAEVPRPAADFTRAAQRIGVSFVDLEVTGKDGRRRFAAGFVLRADGWIVTAEHAVARARRVVARLPDGRRVEARSIAADPLSDVAVARLDGAPELVPAAIAAAAPERGRPVAALGNPLGYGASLTVGVVSAPTRDGGPDTPYDLLQHDAALNPGSSGGPLVDAGGAVVGMNVAIADGARRDVGVAFAVPIEVVTRIADRLIRDGAVPRPRLALRLRDAASLRDAIPALVGDGVVVEAVEPGSAAARAGVAAGRLIVAAEGRPVRTTRDLARALEAKAPGDRFRIVVLDGDTAETFEFALDGGPRSTEPIADAAPTARFGLTLAADETSIAAVAADAPADLAGLRPGDRLLAVGLTRIDAAHPAGPVLDAAVATTTAAGGTALLVERDGATRWLVLDHAGRLDTMAPFGSNSEAASSVLL